MNREDVLFGVFDVLFQLAKIVLGFAFYWGLSCIMPLAVPWISGMPEYVYAVAGGIGALIIAVNLAWGKSFLLNEAFMQTKGYRLMLFAGAVLYLLSFGGFYSEAGSVLAGVYLGLTIFELGGLWFNRLVNRFGVGYGRDDKAAERRQVFGAIAPTMALTLFVVQLLNPVFATAMAMLDDSVFRMAGVISGTCIIAYLLPIKNAYDRLNNAMFVVGIAVFAFHSVRFHNPFAVTLHITLLTLVFFTSFRKHRVSKLTLLEEPVA